MEWSLHWLLNVLMVVIIFVDFSDSWHTCVWWRGSCIDQSPITGPWEILDYILDPQPFNQMSPKYWILLWQIINPYNLWLKHLRNSFKREPKCSHRFNDNLFFFSWRFPKIFQSLEWDVVPWFALFVKDQASIGESRGHKFLSVIGFLCACGVFKP